MLLIVRKLNFIVQLEFLSYFVRNYLKAKSQPNALDATRKQCTRVQEKSDGQIIDKLVGIALILNALQIRTKNPQKAPFKEPPTDEIGAKSDMCEYLIICLFRTHVRQVVGFALINFKYGLYAITKIVKIS